MTHLDHSLLFLIILHCIHIHSPPLHPPLQSVEAILYLLQGVSSHLHQHSSPHLQTVISLFPRMPLHPILVKTALALLGTRTLTFQIILHFGPLRGVHSKLNLECSLIIWQVGKVLVRIVNIISSK